MSHEVTRRTEEVLLFQGDDLPAIAEALQAVNNSLRQVDNDRVGWSPATEAAAAYEALVADATPRAVTVTVQALGRRSYRKLLAACPPRPDNQGDAALGFDQEAMANAVLEFVDDDDPEERTIFRPVLGDKAAIVKWLDNLCDGDFSSLFEAALRINEGRSPNPKVSITSLIERASETT